MVSQKPTVRRKYVYQGAPLLAPPPAELVAILERYRGQPDALITVLEEIQDHYGYLPQQGLPLWRRCALSPSLGRQVARGGSAHRGQRSLFPLIP